jgi:hypothetical protein
VKAHKDSGSAPGCSTSKAFLKHDHDAMRRDDTEEDGKSRIKHNV